VKQIYVCSSCLNITKAEGNSTLIMWKHCGKTIDKCPVAQYFSDKPVMLHTEDSSVCNQHYIFNISPSVDIGLIRRSVQRVQEICKNCDGR